MVLPEALYTYAKWAVVPPDPEPPPLEDPPPDEPPLDDPPPEEPPVEEPPPLPAGGGALALPLDCCCWSTSSMSCFLHMRTG